MRPHAAFLLAVGMAWAATVHAASAYSPPVETPAFKTFFSAAPDERSTVYTVEKGDRLTKIAKKFGVTAELLEKVNGVEPGRLQVGQKLKIPTTKLTVVIDKSQNSLMLKAGEEVLKTYTVATGTNNVTPVGVFTVTTKLVNPTWYHHGKAIPPGDPANLLGSRWMGFDKKGYGIHGTTEPDKLGQQITEGCVRMKNEEVEELYGYLPVGTEVTIVD